MGKKKKVKKATPIAKASEGDDSINGEVDVVSTGVGATDLPVNSVSVEGNEGGIVEGEEAGEDLDKSVLEGAGVDSEDEGDHGDDTNTTNNDDEDSAQQEDNDNTGKGSSRLTKFFGSLTSSGRRLASTVASTITDSLKAPPPNDAVLKAIGNVYSGIFSHSVVINKMSKVLVRDHEKRMAETSAGLLDALKGLEHAEHEIWAVSRQFADEHLPRLSSSISSSVSATTGFLDRIEQRLDAADQDGPHAKVPPHLITQREAFTNEMQGKREALRSAFDAQVQAAYKEFEFEPPHRAAPAPVTASG